MEDDIKAKRDALIAALEKRLHQASNTRERFTIRCSVGKTDDASTNHDFIDTFD